MFTEQNLDPFQDVDLQEDFPPAVVSKVAKMAEKTERIINLFNLPQTETVIQDYRCTLNGNSGKMYITQNYFLFVSKDENQLESFTFTRVVAVAKGKSGLLSGALEVELEGSQKLLFSGLMHRDETFNLLRHLWKFQPTYVFLNEDDILSQINKEYDVPSSMQTPPVVQKSQQQPSGRWNDFSKDIQQVEDHETPDIDLGKYSQKTMLQIQETNARTLNMLSEQAESIDLIEHHVKETKMNFDNGARKLDGIESGAGQVKNIFTPNLHKNKVGAFQKSDREMRVERKENYIDIPILIKQPNDYLEPGLLRFGEKTFRCLNAERKELRKFSYSYSDLFQIIVRARHQHLDLTFRSTTERFRCCSSFLQGIVNELFLRTKAGHISLIHEPNTRRFQYGNHSIRDLSLAANRDEEEESYNDVPVNANYASLLDDVPSTVLAAQQEQDSQINDISSILSDFNSGTAAISKEMQRQTGQIEGIHRQTDKTLHKANETVCRTNKLK